MFLSWGDLLQADTTGSAEGAHLSPCDASSHSHYSQPRAGHSDLRLSGEKSTFPFVCIACLKRVPQP